MPLLTDEQLLTFDEAMKIVDAGGIVACESRWVMVKAGFEWGPWICRMRRWTEDDLRRMKERDAAWTPENQLPQVGATGEYYRSMNTLCESWTAPESSDATDWIDVTDRFEHGSPKGYLDYLHEWKRSSASIPCYREDRDASSD